VIVLTAVRRIFDRLSMRMSQFRRGCISERGVRLLKPKQKISGHLTSNGTIQDQLDIRGYLDPARKHAMDVRPNLRLADPGSHPPRHSSR
jgi:hypothetical protein